VERHPDPRHRQQGRRHAIIPQTETQGTSVLASSIYAVKFGRGEGDQAVTGLTNGGVMVDDLGLLQSQPVYRTRIEFYCGMAVFAGKGAARLTGSGPLRAPSHPGRDHCCYQVVGRRMVDRPT
jgi:hypothetical protein